MKKIYEELSRLQRELKAPKNLYNKFGNYYYRNAEGILEAVKPMLNGLVLIINDEPVMVGGRFYIKATVTLTDGEDSITAVAYAREDEVKKGMDGCQVTGACSSYARKYALNALLMIDDSKDSDDNEYSPKNPKSEEEAPPAGPAFTRPTVSAPTSQADVTQVTELPRQPETPPPVEMTPVTKYLLEEMGKLRAERKVTAAVNNKLFADQKAALAAAGLAPNKGLEKYTLDEAKALVDAMRKCFKGKTAELMTT